MDVKYGVAQAAFFCPNLGELEKVESESSQTSQACHCQC